MRVGEKIHDPVKPMPQPPNPPLSDPDMKTMDTWIGLGAPKFDGTCGSTSGGNDGGSVAPPSAWSMPQDTNDVYVCYGVEADVTSKRHIVAMTPKIDNFSIVHHVLLFQSDTAVDPTPAPCSGGGST